MSKTKRNGSTAVDAGKDGTATSTPQTTQQATPASTSGPADTDPPAALDPEIVKKLSAVRSQVRESFGKIVMAMMMMPRYRNQTLGDLQHLVLEPLIRDRIAIAYPGETTDGALTDMAGFAVWASVSEEVDGRIREQIAAGNFPVRLKPDEWNSGSINWLFDVIAADQRATTNVIANFKQVVKDGSLRLHPLITRLIDEETLKKMGAEKIGKAASVTTN